MQHCATQKERLLFLELPLFLDRGEGGGGTRDVLETLFL